MKKGHRLLQKGILASAGICFPLKENQQAPQQSASNIMSYSISPPPDDDKDHCGV